MYDRQTDSLWAQAYGRAIQGPMEDAQLEMLPSSMMTWGQWVALHPKTLVLSKRVNGRLDGMGNGYARYHSSRQVGVTQTLRFRSNAIDPKARVATFVIGGVSFAVPLAELSSVPILSVLAGDRRVLVVGTPDRRTARIFLTELAEWSLEAGESGRMLVTDGPTGSKWDGATGRALSGPAEGQQLVEIPVTLSYWFAWKTFYPETRLLRR